MKEPLFVFLFLQKQQPYLIVLFALCNNDMTRKRGITAIKGFSVTDE